MNRKPPAQPTTHAHETVGVVLQIRAGTLQVLLWERALPPFAGRWALPGGVLGDESLEHSIRRHLATKVDVRELSTWSSWRRGPSGGADASPPPTSASSAPASTPSFPPTPRGTRSTSCPQTAFDHGSFALAGRERLRAKLSYTNLGFALAPLTFTISELRDLYAAALGHEVSATNLQRVLVRRGVLSPTGDRRPPGRAGGRPAEVFRFRSSDLEITDQFAVLRPPR